MKRYIMYVAKLKCFRVKLKLKCNSNYRVQFAIFLVLLNSLVLISQTRCIIKYA
uniref:Uncharacterized protein n=1 Tax=Rhizophora mucronata TaxID=61149 RepID=A0A2P2IZ18_RHIMU